MNAQQNHSKKSLRVVVLVLIFLCSINISQSHAENSAKNIDKALEAAQAHKSQISSSSAIHDKIITPAMGDDKNFVTYDGKTEFQANISCSSHSPVVQVTAFPVGDIKSVGELNLQVEYDSDIDGKFDGSITVHNVAGVCGNGIIKNCKPSGSWKDCDYCRWEFVDNKLTEVCDYGTGEKEIPIGVEGLHGCFCFNASCGSPTMDMMETILSFTAKGTLDLLQRQNNLLIITQMDYQPGNLQLSYMGSVTGNCASGMTNDADVSALLALNGQIDFPYDNAIEEARKDPQHPYTLLESTFSQGTSSSYKCTKTARVAPELREVERSVLVKFGFGYDADGGSKQCYWGGMNGFYDCRGLVHGHTYSFAQCKNAVIPRALHGICVNQTVNSNIFTKVTKVSDYRAVSGIGNYYGCYGADNDWADQYWEVLCWGLRMEDTFVCNSPSMSLPNETIYNSPYNNKLFQGCSEILPPISTCSALEERTKAGECSLVSEITDGVYTVRDGTNTGLSPTGDCLTFEGTKTSISVCEPWWRKERIYRCDDFDTKFEKEKERAGHIGSAIGYDENSGQWTTQGDITWDNDDNAVEKIIDPDIEFQHEAAACIPACRIGKKAKRTDLFIPTQGKLEPDGNYHLPYDGQISYTTNADTEIQSIQECQQEKEEWVCPLESDERIITDCQCFDEAAFIESVATLQTINLASKDLVCSSGTEQGMCLPEDIGENVNKVMCGDFGAIENGVLDPEKATLWECMPKLWRGKQIADQKHRISITDTYRCGVTIDGVPHIPSLADELPLLRPDRSWFTDAIAWANRAITTRLRTDAQLAPPANASCGCAATKQCAWNFVSARKISEDFELHLDANAAMPFGYVDLTYSVTGTWGNCAPETTTYRFRVGLEKRAPRGFVQSLSLLEPHGIFIAEEPFLHTQMMVKQCLDAYTNSYIDFEDPVTKGKFSFSYADEFAYQLAARTKELPSEKPELEVLQRILPHYPPVYRATYNTDNKNNVVVSSVPNSPMFLGASKTAVWKEEGYDLTLSRLTPYVYYWECPEGRKNKGESNTCGGKSPTGGVDETIDGSYCFQYRCDPKAHVEPNANFSGCGYVNDGKWQ